MPGWSDLGKGVRLGDVVLNVNTEECGWREASGYRPARKREKGRTRAPPGDGVSEKLSDAQRAGYRHLCGKVDGGVPYALQVCLKTTRPGRMVLDGVNNDPAGFGVYAGNVFSGKVDSDVGAKTYDTGLVGAVKRVEEKLGGKF